MPRVPGEPSAEPPTHAPARDHRHGSRADGNPKAVVLVTRVLGVNGLSSGAYPHQLAVHYRSDYGSGKWFIRGWGNDGEVMTPGATINVVVQAF